MNHRRIASFANSRGDVRDSGIRRNVRISRRHEATHLSKKSAKLKYQVAVIGIPHGKATSPVNIAHSPFISAKWSKLNSAGKRNMLASQPDAAPVRRSRAVSRDDPSATSPCAGVVSFNRDRIVREVQSERTKPHIFKN
jgi:hypothetical protein